MLIALHFCDIIFLKGSNIMIPRRNRREEESPDGMLAIHVGEKVYHKFYSDSARTKLISLAVISYNYLDGYVG